MFQNTALPRLTTFLLYYLIFSGSLLVAQSDGNGPDFFFDNFPLPRGLNGNHVQAIAQDSSGFIWFGSQSGLHRWDGYEMRTYLHDREDSTSIASSYIEYLYVGKDGSLWVGTYGYGLDRFNYQRETFEHIDYVRGNPEIAGRGQVAGITEDADGRLWIATHGGLYRYDTATGNSRQFLHNPNVPTSLSHDLARVVYVDKRGTLWVGTGMPWENDEGGGLNRYRPETEDFVRYVHEPGDTSGLASNKVSAIFEDSRNQLWIGSGRHGLHLLDRATDRIVRVEATPNETWSKGQQHLNHVRSIFEDRDHRLWVSYWQGGITSLNPATGQTKDYTFQEGQENGLPEPFPWQVFQSRDGTLWALTAGPGATVSRMMENVWRIRELRGLNHQINGVGIAGNGDLWLGDTGGELLRFDMHGGELSVVAPVGTLPEQCSDFAEDRQGNIWFFDYSGQALFRYAPTSGESVAYRHDDADNRSVAAGNVINFTMDAKGRIWLLNDRGILSRYHPEFDGFKHYPVIDYPDTSVRVEYYKSIAEAADGKLWVVGSGFARDGSATVVRRFVPETGMFDLEVDVESFTKYFSADERLYDSESDRDGNLYLVSGRHFISIGPNGEDKLVVNASHFGARGFSDLVVDKQQRVWLVTDELLLFDPRTDVYSIVPTPSSYREYIYNRGLLFNNQSGKMYTGTDEGLLEIDPSKVGGVPISGPAESMISGFALLTSDRQPAGAGTSEPAFDLGTPIRLEHHQNAFTVRFGNLNFRNPESSRQEIQLAGYEDFWRPASESGLATYVGLRPGKYRFQVRTANNNGSWGEPAVLDIRVANPWWKTWWAYLIYCALAAGLVAAVYQIQLNIRLEKSEARRLKELDEVRSRLYTNITHEFRTPLTVISGMAAQIEADPDRWLGEGLTMIERNTQRLLGLVNQLLDLSKLNNGGTQVNIQHGDVVAYLRYVLDSVNGLASVKGVGLHFYAEDSVIDMDFDPEKLQRIFVNLLSNALKFTPQNGQVYVTLRKLTPKDPANPFTGPMALCLRVRDTGVGIEEERLPFIFDRFYQADDSDTRRAEGTGIGLALTRELVHLLEGNIDVKSRPDQGTEFTVLLPITARSGTPALNPVSAVSTPTPAFLPDPAPAAAPQNFTSDKPRLLLIEDNVDVLAYLATCLGDDYELLVGGDGREGLDIAYENIPDLIITDVMMPRLDGLSVCRELKNDTRTSHIPIVVLTAKADENSKLASLETGADAYLTKPFHRRELLLRVEKLIEGRTRMRNYYLDAGEEEAPEQVEAPKEEDKREKRFVEGLRKTVEAHLDDYEFTVETFCQEVGMSSSQLHRKLTALTGLSPNRFIRYVRLNRAKSLLEDAEATIKVVAYDTGFSDPSYFSRAFKKEFGMTPVEYRDRLPERVREPE